MKRGMFAFLRSATFGNRKGSAVLMPRGYITQYQQGQVYDRDNGFCTEDAGQPAAAEMLDPVEMIVMVFAVVIGVAGFI